jgi:riboflavin biosynthesis pyrimidine reductase
VRFPFGQGDRRLGCVGPARVSRHVGSLRPAVSAGSNGGPVAPTPIAGRRANSTGWHVAPTATARKTNWQDRRVQSLFPTTPTDLSDDDLVELYAYPADGRWARANFVATADGAAQGPDLKSGSISPRADQRLFALLRSLSDVILVGAGTARVEGYQPVQPHEVDADLRAELGLTPTPTLAVLSRSLDLDPDLLAGGQAPTIVITCDDAAADRLEETRQLAEVVMCGGLEVDLVTVFDTLADMGLTRILLEGGPTVLHQAASAGCLDELCLTLSPVLTGGDRKRIVDGAALVPSDHLQLRHVLEDDGTLFLRYFVGDRTGTTATRLA